MTEDTDSKLLPAETKLAAAVNQGIMCRLVSSDTNQEPDRKLTLEDMQKWSDDHVIRASFLKKLLDRNQNTSVHVSGAIIDGALFLTGQQIHILYLEKCFIRGEVHADGMKAGSLTFINCVFSAHVGLVASTVDAFAFTGCTTLRPVWFRDSIWGSAMFDNTELLAKAWFDHMIVTGRATFTEGQFHDVDFSGSRFLNDATFTGTHFSGEARFTDAVAQTWNFNGAQFDDPNPGLWTGNNIDLSDTTFRKRGHLTVMAKTVTARRLRSIEGTQLSVRSETLDLTEADFQGPSIVTSYQLDESDRVAFPIPLDTLDSFPLAKDIREYAINRSNAFTEQIVNTVRQIPGCELRSLRRASVAKLALTKVSLGNCRFADAHNLEQIRIGHECTFHRPRRLLRTRRDTIAEEDLWRESRRTNTGPPFDVPSPGEIAAIYRSLRKSFEDTKNEPGAADFYYGEMEMRRHAAAPRSFDRWLLNAYWAISGYGLRASRALLILVATLVLAGVLYHQPAFAQVVTPGRITALNFDNGTLVYSKPSKSPVPFPEALEFAAQQSISLLWRPPTAIATSHGGTWLAWALHLVCPGLLALAVVALRARIKR